MIIIESKRKKYKRCTFCHFCAKLSIKTMIIFPNKQNKCYICKRKQAKNAATLEKFLSDEIEGNSEKKQVIKTASEF